MLIIDGYNLLHVVRKVEEWPEKTGGARLCKIVDSYLALIGQTGAVIFDGTGPPDKSGFDGTGSLEVLFAGSHADADTAIEDKISASTSPRNLTIVSSDRRLRKAARTRRCESLRSEVFWDNVQRQLSRKRPAKEPAAKREGLSESETDQWLDVFGFEK